MQSISGKSGTTISTLEITRSLWRSCAIFTAIQSRQGCAIVRRTGSGAAFATTQPALNGPPALGFFGEGSVEIELERTAKEANERQEHSVQLSNCPTQAKPGL